MCLIVYGKNSNVQKLDLLRAWEVNSDGAGIVIPGRSPKVYKGIMDYETLLCSLATIADNTPIALHLRSATHGAISESNTHPFRLGKDNWLMHNGVLTGLGSPGINGQSDSAELAKILRNTRPCDRSKLLDLLPGRYLVVNRSNVTLHGQFSKLNTCYVSNTYWQAASQLVTTGRDWLNDKHNSKYYLSDYVYNVDQGTND